MAKEDNASRMMQATLATGPPALWQRLSGAVRFRKFLLKRILFDISYGIHLY
jgi:hypothetical protein